MADTVACADCKPDGSNPAEQSTLPPQPVTASIDPSTFVPPPPDLAPTITIEFCDRCRWLHRASWVSTELFLTFPSPTLKAITIVPLNAEDTAGRFRVWLSLANQPPILVWDRKVEGGFPELKVLKQRIRDHIQPGKSLGHSDK
ncbi:Rdx family-domain-containing protein [Cubamyces lactineus]|nr:Rdx family-domain-containing protein [Cubamyces lactineus]